MKKIILLGIIAVSCICCTARRKAQGMNVTCRKDTLFIDKERCAIFFKLSLAELNDIKKAYKTKEEFYAASDGIAEDKFQIKTFLEENNIPIIYADTMIKVIRFKDCDVNVVDTSIAKAIWTSVILYKNNKRYIVMQDPNIDFISNYFNIYMRDKENIKQVQNHRWFGDYEYFISDTTVAPAPFVEYTLSITADRCIFSGNGQMTVFEVQCSVKTEAEDKLSFDFAKSLSEVEPIPHIDRSISPIVNLYYRGGKYYLESPFVSNSEGQENVKIECRKIK